MKVYTHHFQQFIPASLAETWLFFASPLNLLKITPDFMKFKVTSDFQEGDRMYEGMLISYKVSPLFNVPLSWVTEITAMENEKYFIDEQRFGPFKLWHHEHHFTAVDGGVMMKDKLSYAMPLGILGSIAHTVSVKNKVQQIFEYRKTAIEDFFG